MVLIPITGEKEAKTPGLVTMKARQGPQFETKSGLRHAERLLGRSMLQTRPRPRTMLSHKRLSLPTSFFIHLQGCYSLAHPEQPLPAPPDRLPARQAVVPSCQKAAPPPPAPCDASTPPTARRTSRPGASAPPAQRR